MHPTINESLKMMHSDEKLCIHCSKRHTSVFCKIGEESLNILDENKKCLTYKKGQIIFQQSNESRGVYCIDSGKVKLVQIGEEGKEQIVRLAKEGDMLGYRALLSGDTYSATAVVIEEANLCYIPREAFFRVMNAENNVTMEILKRLAEDLKRAQERITLVTQKTVKERAAETLLFLKEVFGFEEDKLTLNVTLSRDELASLVGTATESLIRALSDFKSEKIIEFNGKRIKLKNIEALIFKANILE